MSSIEEMMTIETLLLEASAYGIREEVNSLAETIYAQVYDMPDAFPENYLLVDAYKDAFVTYVKEYKNDSE